MNNNNHSAPIGVFDSGYGGLTILREFVNRLPAYDFVYLGDNARSPYGSRSFQAVYHYTLEAVKKLFGLGCPLVILACNTSSAKALRSIQQTDLPLIAPDRRVLGVIRPTAETVEKYTLSKHVGILGTPGTINSGSYLLEIEKLSPQLTVFQEACPMWVSLVENDEFNNPGAEYFIRKNVENLLARDPRIDAIILGCTHYPLLVDIIRKFIPSHVKLISQDNIVADSLIDYLNRHPEMNNRISKLGNIQFFTTDSIELFEKRGSVFFRKPFHAEQIDL
ncbi:MAG: glutamate racemase [Bacteroidia bacterium]|nr:glutamate racemase [Bacteroidia bacterium]